jgi:hypothetical protein
MKPLMIVAAVLGPHVSSKIRTFMVGALILSFAFAAPAAAQWIGYPTPGIPRLPNGQPNMNAPAPKTADGKPDLSGI